MKNGKMDCTDYWIARLLDYQIKKSGHKAALRMYIK